MGTLRTASCFPDPCMEAGHAAQNLLLQAVALDLGVVPIGAFNDDHLSEILGLPDHEAPLYLIPIGHPR
jgi:nitroreductase